MIADPYPEDITSDLVPLGEPDPLVRAVNRLAAALEQNTLAILDQRPKVQAPVQFGQQLAQTALAPLPPVQVVQNRPSCPFHGPDKVASSTNGKGGFYCQAKAQPGQPSNPKGYCTWHS